MIYNRADLDKFDKEALDIRKKQEDMRRDLDEMSKKAAVRDYLMKELISKHEELIARLDGTAKPKQYNKEWWE